MKWISIKPYTRSRPKSMARTIRATCLSSTSSTASQNIIETVSTLAHLSRFVIADVTDAKTIAAELQSIVQGINTVPVQLLLAESDKGYAGLEAILMASSVLPLYRYENSEKLLASLKDNVLIPANDRADQLQKKLELIRQQLATGTP